MMDVLRTPDARFASLAEFAFAPHYVDIPSGADGTLRAHVVDEGARDATPVLLLHGEPTWSYLYRNVVPRLTAAGVRAVAPDLIGFGRSDKPAERDAYTYARHVAWLRAVVEALDLRDAVLVGQDWGGLLGLRLLPEIGERFRAVVVANTFLPTGDEPENEAFLRWQAYSQRADPFLAGEIVARTCARRPPPDVVAGYDAPFPEPRYQAGARAFPLLVPTRPDDPASDDNRRAWSTLRAWTKPFLTAFSDGDPVTRGAERIFQREVPGARDRGHVTIAGASHFLQEDDPAAFAAAVLSVLG